MPGCSGAPEPALLEKEEITDDEVRYEQKVKLKQMEVDIELKQRQLFWETPRNLAIVVGTAVAVAGWAGYKLGIQPPQVIQVQLLTPLPALTAPAPAQPRPQ